MIWLSRLLHLLTYGIRSRQVVSPECLAHHARAEYARGIEQACVRHWPIERES